jgi:pyruvate/2-oxoglutarate/acetoin dehydrogenase E1 component
MNNFNFIPFQTNQLTEPLFSQVVVPSTPAEAKGLLLASIRDPNPVIFLEPKWLYRSSIEMVPLADYTIPLSKARIIREVSSNHNSLVICTISNIDMFCLFSLFSEKKG